MEISARIRKLCDKYNMEPEDVAYADLMIVGWAKHEAAYYAYNLGYFDMPKISTWLRDKMRLVPGINKMVEDFQEEERTNRRKQRELEEKLKQATKRKKELSDLDNGDDKMSKDELGKMYVRIMRDPQSDDKTKMEASKAYSSLYQMQKEQEKEEENRINFFLPVNCHYCDRCKNCELKVELEKMNFEIRAKKTSPYLWEIVKKPNNE